MDMELETANKITLNRLMDDPTTETDKLVIIGKRSALNKARGSYTLEVVTAGRNKGIQVKDELGNATLGAPLGKPPLTCASTTQQLMSLPEEEDGPQTQVSHMRTPTS